MTILRVILIKTIIASISHTFPRPFPRFQASYRSPRHDNREKRDQIAQERHGPISRRPLAVNAKDVGKNKPVGGRRYKPGIFVENHVAVFCQKKRRSIDRSH